MKSRRFNVAPRVARLSATVVRAASSCPTAFRADGFAVSNFAVSLIASKAFTISVYPFPAVVASVAVVAKAVAAVVTLVASALSNPAALNAAPNAATAAFCAVRLAALA